MTPTENPFDSIHSTLTGSSRDMGLDRRDAWIYGIVVGWSDYDDDDSPEESAMQELAAKHGWTPEAVARLKRLNAIFNQQKELHKK